MKNCQVVVYGEIAIDNIIKVPHPVDREKDTMVIEEEYLIGGYASNVSSLLALWETPVRIAGYELGDDALGNLMLKLLGKYPLIDVSHVEIKRGIETALCRIIVPPNGDRYIMAFNFIDRCAHPTPLTKEILGDATHIVFDSLARREAFLPALKLAHASGLCIIGSDVNSLDNQVVPYANVICNSAGLLKNKDGITDPLPFIRKLHQENNATVITTNGPRAVHVIDNHGEEFWVHPLVIADELIVDTTGAGDSLKAGVAYGLVRGWPLEKAVRFGVVVSSFIIQAFGAITREPKVDEVMALIDQVRVSKDAAG
jgi:sugar/nucleoside kinase (ribokinase family)